MSRDYDIVVAGAGVVGLSAAAILGNERVRVSVVDAADGPPRDTADIALRVSAIAQGSMALLERLAAWDRIPGSKRCAYQHMRVWDAADDADSASALRFDAEEFGLAALGEIVENAAIQRALIDRLDVLGVEVRYGKRIDALERADGQVSLGFDDGSAMSADLLVAADGVRSPIRELAGIDVSRWPYAQTAIVTHLRPERPHRATAWQRFLQTGPLALLPLADGRVSTVWSTSDPDAALDADDEGLSQMLSEASGHVLGELAVDGPRGSFPLNAHHAAHYVDENIALVGDAAHAIHPLAGQGANLGFQDVAELANVITTALAQGRHPGDKRVLRRYERARKGANAGMLHALTALNRLFTSRLPLAGPLRRSGMQLFNMSGPVRDRIVQVALGTSP